MKKVFRFAFIVLALFSYALAQWGTGVFVNGVELSQTEMLTLAYYGIHLPSGFYWFDPVTGQFGPETTPWYPQQPYTFESIQSPYGSTYVDGDFTGFFSPDGSVTCGPDGGCLY